jgi:hypothetical protein
VQTEREVILVDLLGAASGQAEQLRMELRTISRARSAGAVVFHDAFVDDEMPIRTSLGARRSHRRLERAPALSPMRPNHAV